MCTEVLKLAEINEAEKAFAKLVNGQMMRVTQELLKLEQLLKAGMVDGNVLHEFRKAVDQARKTSWALQQAFDSGEKTPIS